MHVRGRVCVCEWAHVSVNFAIPSRVQHEGGTWKGRGCLHQPMWAGRGQGERVGVRVWVSPVLGLCAHRHGGRSGYRAPARNHAQTCTYATHATSPQTHASQSSGHLVTAMTLPWQPPGNRRTPRRHAATPPPAPLRSQLDDESANQQCRLYLWPALAPMAPGPGAGSGEEAGGHMGSMMAPRDLIRARITGGWRLESWVGWRSASLACALRAGQGRVRRGGVLDGWDRKLVHAPHKTVVEHRPQPL